MSKKKADFSRRDFLKTAGAVGLGSMIAPIDNLTHAKGLYVANDSQQNTVPTRPFGKTGVDVSILGLGGGFRGSNMLLMKQAVNLGVTYWDTAVMYGGGNSEKGIGEYLKKYPEDRNKIFLVTKSIFGPEKFLTNNLETSLGRMKTDYIDLFFIHNVKNVDWQLTKEVKAWAEKAKSSGKIRLFGFSTHSKMEQCLIEGAKLGWIDGIMLSYNFRIMHNDLMKKAVDNCADVGIGLTAMKTQAVGNLGTEMVDPNEKERNFLDKLGNKGLTQEQAKLIAVWNDDRIASICSRMTSMRLLSENASAAMENKILSDEDKILMNQYARKTACDYCAGCSHNCEPTLNNEVPISDVMRYLMYYRGYREPERAKSAFRRIPSKTRNLMARLDYREAERKCPQGMQIGRLLREAVIELA